MGLAYKARGADKIWDTATDNSMCQINTIVDLRDFLKTDVTISDRGSSTLVVSFPEIDPVRQLKVPARTTTVNLKVITVSSAFRPRGIGSEFCLQQFSFDYEKKTVQAKDIILKLQQAEPGDIAIITIAIEYEIMGKDQKLLNPKWLPVAVIAMGRLK